MAAAGGMTVRLRSSVAEYTLENVPPHATVATLKARVLEVHNARNAVQCTAAELVVMAKPGEVLEDTARVQGVPAGGGGVRVLALVTADDMRGGGGPEVVRSLLRVGRRRRTPPAFAGTHKQPPAARATGAGGGVKAPPPQGGAKVPVRSEAGTPAPSSCAGVSSSSTAERSTRSATLSLPPFVAAVSEAAAAPHLCNPVSQPSTVPAAGALSRAPSLCEEKDVPRATAGVLHQKPAGAALAFHITLETFLVINGRRQAGAYKVTSVKPHHTIARILRLVRKRVAAAAVDWDASAPLTVLVRGAAAAEDATLEALGVGCNDVLVVIAGAADSSGCGLCDAPHTAFCTATGAPHASAGGAPRSALRQPGQRSPRAVRWVAASPAAPTPANPPPQESLTVIPMAHWRHRPAHDDDALRTHSSTATSSSLQCPPPPAQSEADEVPAAAPAPPTAFRTLSPEALGTVLIDEGDDPRDEFVACAGAPQLQPSSAARGGSSCKDCGFVDAAPFCPATGREHVVAVTTAAVRPHPMASPLLAPRDAPSGAPWRCDVPAQASPAWEAPARTGHSLTVAATSGAGGILPAEPARSPPSHAEQRTAARMERVRVAEMQRRQWQRTHGGLG
eukprot:TRINITY_DN10092_c0_g1_i2.p1 TRINITY_DN10092_c0_g1~~TRINITY_DN10092_c0_g1_i2.p1  ORF type:complete len:643 (+),score=127.78 TRINITY_DN10092_c0_g1_i2:70-1929(+)